MTGPWVSGESLSPTRLNLHAGGATLPTGFSTDTLQGQSGLTVNVISDLSAQNVLAGQRLELGGAPSSTSGLASLRAHSQQTDYLFFQDAAGIKSNFLLGLKTGDSNASNVDGLNLYDASDNTMIVRFSSDSVRFYPPIVAPVFDTGGALADTYNAALFLRGSSKESQIQAAITAAAADGISRVYVPASLYPYSAGSVIFNTDVQMVREGGDWAVFDVQAYGAAGNNVQDDTLAIKSAISGAAAAAISNGGLVAIPSGVYLTSSMLVMYNNVQMRGYGSRNAATIKAVPTFNFSTQTAMIAIGSRTTLAFGSVLADLYFDCSSIISSIGVWMPGANEASGCERVHVANVEWRAFWVDATGGVGKAQNCFLRDIDLSLISSARSGAIGVLVEGASDQRGIDGLTVDVTPDGASLTTGGIGLSINGVGGTYERLHFEGVNIGMDIGPTQSCNGVIVNGATGSSSTEMSTLIRINGATGSQNIFLSGLQKRSATNIVADQFTSDGTVTATDLAFYSLGNGSVRPRMSSQVFLPQKLNQDIWFTSNGRLVRAPTITPSDGSTIPAVDGGDQFNLANTSLTTITDFSNGSNGQHIMVQATTANNIVVSGTSIRLRSNSNWSMNINDTLILHRKGGTWWEVGSYASQFYYFASGTATAPSMAMGSEHSLGFYRSGTSSVALSYGTLQVPFLRVVSGGDNFVLGNVSGASRIQTGSGGFQVLGANDALTRFSSYDISLDNFGTAAAPAFTYVSEQSLGWYRSAASTMALSYGSLNLNQARLVSIRTAASLDSTSLATNEMAFQIVAGSVATLAIRSGGTIYFFASSASTKG